MNTTNKNIKKSLNILIAMLVVATVGMSISGCDSEDTSTYDVTIKWNIGGLPICKASLPEPPFTQPEVAFGTVEINVYEDETKAVMVQEAISVPCANLQAELTRLKRDSYYITVDAWGDYAGAQLPFYHGESPLDVPVKDDAPIDVPLVVGKGTVQVLWQFAGGFTCGVETAGEIVNVAIKLDDAKPVIATCAEGQLVLENVAIGQSHEITAFAMNAQGETIYTTYHLNTSGTTDFQVLPGEVYKAVVIFK